jgi:hypothetical protein
VAALRFAPPLTNVFAASQAVSSDGFVGVRVALFRVVNGRSFRSEITMGWTGICHPEWGYLAASRRSTWKLRLCIFAAAIGASAPRRLGQYAARWLSSGGGSVRCEAHVDASW